MTAERVTAWGQEIREVHRRLRDSLHLARESVEHGTDAARPSRDLLLFCRGFCVALDGHHSSEDRSLFPIVSRRHPELESVVADLMRDHGFIAHLIRELEHSIGLVADRATLLRHLDGIEAVMETHFRFEEKRLVAVLDAMDDVREEKAVLLGPLG